MGGLAISTTVHYFLSINVVLFHKGHVLTAYNHFNSNTLKFSSSFKIWSYKSKVCSWQSERKSFFRGGLDTLMHREDLIYRSPIFPPVTSYAWALPILYADFNTSNVSALQCFWVEDFLLRAFSGTTITSSVSLSLGCEVKSLSL